MSVPNYGYSRHASCALNSISMLFLLSYSSSLIYHILFNTSEQIDQSNVIEVGISDHFINVCMKKQLKNTQANRAGAV
jgi:hypothetical protein